jgi:hypothetical protein
MEINNYNITSIIIFNNITSINQIENIIKNKIHQYVYLITSMRIINTYKDNKYKIIIKMKCNENTIKNVYGILNKYGCTRYDINKNEKYISIEDDINEDINENNNDNDDENNLPF